MTFVLDADGYRLVVVVATFLAAAHAWRKLSPFFAAHWFGAGLVFGWLWTDARAAPEAVLLPALVVYTAAAITKGLVETRDGVRGNHLVHVLLTGLFAGWLALPFEFAARAAGFTLPRVLDGELFGVGAHATLGVPLGAVWAWTVLGGVFYGAYKLFDHCGLPKAAQSVVVFGAQPLLVLAVERLSALLR